MVEKQHGTLLGPFSAKPHKDFTWFHLMTRPRGLGRRVILDIVFGDYSVKKATSNGTYEGLDYTLKLPRLDDLVST